MSEQTVTNEVCFINIGPQQRRIRLISGLVNFIIAVAIAAFLILTGASRWWRLVLFIIFFFAATGFFQWHDKT